MINRYVNVPTAPLGGLATALLVGAIGLAGCTSSLPSDPNTTWGDVWDPSDDRVAVTLGLGEDVSPPRGLAEAVSERTDAELRIVTTDVFGGPESSERPQSGWDAAQSGELEEPDLVLSVFPEGEAPSDAKLVGDEDVCVLADLSWYSANNKTAPKAKKDLREEDLMAILKVWDPNVSGTAAANVPLWKGELTQQAQAEEAALPDADSPDGEPLDGVAPQSGDEQETPIDLGSLPFPAPGKIGSSLEAIRSKNNIGTSVRYQVVEGTCAKAFTYLIVEPSAGDAAKEVANFLASEDGKALLASYFLTSGEDVATEQSEAPARVKGAKAFSAAEVQEAITAWDEVFVK